MEDVVPATAPRHAAANSLVAWKTHKHSRMKQFAALALPDLHAGFTLIELVVTLIVIGILAATVVPRFFGNHGFEERGFYDETIAALRYAQKSAISHRRLVCVAFTAQTVTLTIAANNPAAACNTPLAAPTGDDASMAPNIVDATATGNPKYRNATIAFLPVPAPITFNPLGEPNAGATIQVKNFSSAITVEAVTGYVH